MQHFLDNLSDGIMGAGAMIVAIIITLFFRICGVIKEDWEWGYKLTWKERRPALIWLLVLSAIQIWALMRFMENNQGQF